MDGMLLSGILHRSLIGCYSILLVLLVRLFLKRISRKYCYVLWIVVFLNLCIPFSVFSSFSLIPQRVMEFSVDYKEQPEENVSNTEKPVQNMIVFSENGMFSHSKDIQEIISQTEPEIEQISESLKEKPFSKELLFVWLERIWVLGIASLGFYSFLSAIQFKKRIKNGNIKVYDKQERIFTLQGLSTPILWGIISPGIYLPEDLETKERTYIIEHEKCHRRRKDHVIKPILYAITMVYWFHPLVWFAYRSCCQDMEISCDELVLERSEQSIRKDYARSLLKYAAKQNGFLLKPLTFGESSLRSRIVYVLKYRRRGVWVTAAAVAVCIFVAAGLILRPASNKTTHEISPEKMEIVSSDVSIINNGGEVVRINNDIYYMNGKPLYTDGKLLYATQTNDEGVDYVYQYELDQSGFKQLMQGTAVGITDDRELLYYLSSEEDGNISLWCYNTATSATNQIYEGEPLNEDQISCVYVTDSHLLFAAGAYEGSAGYFNGEFYSFDRSTKELHQAHFTDDDSFFIYKEKIYYSKYFNDNEEEGSDLYCSDLDLRNEMLVGENMTFLSASEKENRILVSTNGKIFSFLPDGSDGKCIFDITENGWEWDEYDKIYFTEVNVIENTLFCRVEKWGYEEGNGWRDTLINSQHYQVAMDGSSCQIWNPDAVLAESAEAFSYLSDPLPGIPCENPVDHGWNLENAKDIRGNFSYMSYVPEEGTEGYTYLIGQTDVFTLYGMGDYGTMLLECEGKYAEIRYEYTSNYMTPLKLMEIDLDKDGKEELAIKFNIKHGTGVSIDTFLLADFGEDGQLYVHQFLDEDFTAQLAEHVSFEKKPDGIQPMVDGQPAGFFEKNRDDVAPFLTATVGSQMHFYYDQLNREIQLSGDIMLLWDDIGGTYGCNSNDVTGTVHWDGEHFYLDNFTSKNRSLEEQVTYALQELYHVPKLHYVNVRYDSSEMNRDTIVITAEILPKETDSSFDYAEIHLKRDREPYSVSGWNIEDIYLEK